MNDPTRSTKPAAAKADSARRPKRRHTDPRTEWAETVTGADQIDGRKFITVSSVPIKALYAPEDIDGINFDRDIGYPGQPPYTR
ncbi:MAG TPA: hypothetical protein VM118_13295, partial [Acidobacteriota bacterium]|nr:hypothetical protein [Acidobacteriota bacterium]